MNMFKKNGGFTLVELIVVIAILAILAGVAIPAYSGYIKKAQDVNVVTELDAIVTAAQAANAQNGAISKIVLASDGKTVTVTAAVSIYSGFVTDFNTFYGASGNVTNNVASLSLTNEIKLSGTSYAGGATWDGTEWKAN